ncbi:MAG: hypothetical protein H0Z28_09705 [Archaeoglobus sp.]|nr:hypothetical protein [Archaeoglobus sp.]
MKKSFLLFVVVALLLLVVPVNAQFQFKPWKWEQVSEEGFRDLNNDYAWAMAVYTPIDGSTEYLYVGTLNTASLTNPPTPSSGAQVWRTNGTMVDGKYVWEQVVGPAGSQATAGFTSVDNKSFALGVRGMTEYNGLLWAGTLPLAEIFVTNGTTWKRANLPGFGVVNISSVTTGSLTSTRGITVYKGKIYAEAEDKENGVRIFRYNGSTNFDEIGSLPNQMAWEQVNYPGFDGTNYSRTASELIVYDPPDDGKNIEYLYAFTWTVDAADIIRTSPSEMKGFEIWRTDGAKNPDGTLKWECVVGRNSSYGNSPGLGDNANGGVLSVVIFKGKLYIGTANFKDGAEIWRTSDGVHWEPVELFGFGRTNGYIWRMIEYNGKLVVGTMNPFMGCEIWVSDTGDPGTFRQVNLNGMDLSYNLPVNIGALFDKDLTVKLADQYGIRAVAKYQGYLVIGTASWGDWIDKLLYNATNGKWEGASDYVGLEIWRTDGTLYTPREIDIDKKAWDANTNQWVDRLDANVGDTIRFNYTIHNDQTTDLEDIVVWDYLSSGLKYSGNSTIPPVVLDFSSLPRDLWMFNRNLGTILVWDLHGMTITPGDSLSIEYDADVVKEGKSVNIVVSVGKFGNEGGLSEDELIIDVGKLWKWEQVSEEGFGDLNNDYTFSMAVYNTGDKEYLYVGTLNTQTGAEIWRTDGTIGTDGKYIWEPVVGLSGTQMPAGFGQGITGARGMVVYDRLLWVGCMDKTPDLPGLAYVWVTDGTDWRLANIPGFNNSDASIRGMAVFNGELYVATQRYKGGGADIYRYTGPAANGDLNKVDPNAWERVFSVSADEADAIGVLLEYKGYLYAFGWSIGINTVGLSSWHGFEIYRSSDGTSWEKVVGDSATTPRGFGDDANHAVLSATVFNDMLYVGTLNFKDGAEIWRTSDGVHWEPVELFGFGRTNGYIWRMIEYNGKLVVGTMNPFMGCEIWVSDTGDPGTFRQVNLNGMDLSYNLPVNIGALFDKDLTVKLADQYGIRAVAKYQGYLVIGTASWGDWIDKLLYNATNGKWEGASDYVGLEIWRTDGTLYTPREIDIDKKAWDANTNQWVDRLDANVGDTIRFNYTIHNDQTTDLEDIVVWDYLSSGLKYSGNSTIPPVVLDFSSLPRDLWMFNRNLGTILVWDLHGMTITPGDSLSIEYDADVVKEGKSVNIVLSAGKFGSACCGESGIGCDKVVIHGKQAPPQPIPEFSPIGFVAAFFSVVVAILWRRRVV